MWQSEDEGKILLFHHENCSGNDIMRDEIFFIVGTWKDLFHVFHARFYDVKVSLNYIFVSIHSLPSTFYSFKTRK